MDVEELHHSELLELDPEGGIIRFAGQRALMLDAVATGLLRKYLVDNFGVTAARAVLTQFGFAHGAFTGATRSAVSQPLAAPTASPHRIDGPAPAAPELRRGNSP